MARLCYFKYNITEVNDMTKKALPTYTLGEELTNSISHGIGACLSVAALVLCIVRAAINIETVGAAGVVGASIYGSTLVILYCMSMSLQKYVPQELPCGTFQVHLVNISFTLCISTTRFALCIS